MTVSGYTSTDVTTFINPEVDPRQLGILAISLGGSRVHSSHGTLSDWDGFGILRTKEEICHLVSARRDDLCELLWIEREECPSWIGINDCHWDVLRFSGRAKDGTKRTIKFWTVECLRAAYSDPRLCRLGVLSNRAVKTFLRNYHHNLGSVLYAYQPERVSKDLYVLEDADFLIPQTLNNELHHPSPGVTCDLLLTSVAVFDTNNMLELFKFAIISKWLKLGGTKGVVEMVDSIYSSKTFTLDYRQNLVQEISRVSLSRSNHRTLTDCQKLPKMERLVIVSIHDGPVIKTFQDGYRLTCFIGIPKISGPRYSPSCPEQMYQQPIITTSEFIMVSQTTEYINSPFSSNSAGFCSRAMLKDTDILVDIFVKSGSGVAAEVTALSTLQAQFPPCMLQRVLAFDPPSNCVYYEKYIGRTVSDVRLTYSKGNLEDPFKCTQSMFDWLVNVELARAQQVAAVQLNTIRLEAVHKEQMIHRFYYDRLHLDRRAEQFYGIKSPEFFRTEQNRRLTFKEFMLLPLIINGRQLDSLHQCSRRAELILDPQGRHLSNSSVAVGLGDGHGGNVMATLEKDVALRFVDYEVAGWHNPVLDLAKPLYIDAFFSVLYSELLYQCNEMATCVSNEHHHVHYRITGEAIIVDLDIHLNLLDRTLTYTKLEHMLRPLWVKLAGEFPNDLEFAEDILGAALFSCAFLTRNFSMHPDAFFLNVAVGVLLLSDLKGTLDLFFRWVNWPLTLDDAAANLESLRALTKSGASLDCLDLQQDLEQVVVNTISAFRSVIMAGLEPEMVFLKRFEETLQLHERFSKDTDESSGKVIARIENARKLGIKIAPHTCIRESIFAEPRIDHHFQYASVISQGQASSPQPTKLVDVGCCMGSDLRKLIVDGFAVKDLLGMDIQQGFFEMGKVLYNEEPTSQGFLFRMADLLANDFYYCNADLNSRFDFVHSANVIHLFSPAQQVQFFNALAFLAKPGGLIWGRQVGLSEDDMIDEYRQPSGKGARFTATEFKTLILEATGWAEDDVAYEYRIVEYDEIRIARKDKRWVLQWSVRVPLDKDPKTRLVEISEQSA